MKNIQNDHTEAKGMAFSLSISYPYSILYFFGPSADSSIVDSGCESSARCNSAFFHFAQRMT